VLIISCSPSSFNATETVSTLRFGTRAKSIQNKVVMNKTRSVEELEALLARSEKAIDAMATHITSLTTQLQLAQLGGGGGVAVMPATDGGEDNPQALSLIAQLQEKVADLELQLVDEKEEASRRDEEVGALKELLVNKERVLQESDALMQEAQAHIEEKRIHTDKVIKEKTELASHLEEIQSKMELEYSKSNFAVKELQVTVDTLRKENSHLQAELKEYAGEKRSVMGDNDDRSEKAVSTTSERDSASYKGFALEGIELHFGGDMENLSKK
jgi:kinesin family protein 5